MITEPAHRRRRLGVRPRVVRPRSRALSGGRWARHLAPEAFVSWQECWQLEFGLRAVHRDAYALLTSRYPTGSSLVSGSTACAMIDARANARSWASGTATFTSFAAHHTVTCPGLENVRAPINGIVSCEWVPVCNSDSIVPAEDAAPMPPRSPHAINTAGAGATSDAEAQIVAVMEYEPAGRSIVSTDASGVLFRSPYSGQAQSCLVIAGLGSCWPGITLRPTQAGSLERQGSPLSPFAPSFPS